MFSYNGDGIPHSIQPPTLDKLNVPAGNMHSHMGHYLPPESPILQGALSMTSAVPFTNFHNQRSHFSCASLTSNMLKESHGFRDLQNVTSSDIPNMNLPTNLSVPNMNLGRDSDDTVKDLAPHLQLNVEEKFPAEYDRSRNLLNIPNYRLSKTDERVNVNGYKYESYQSYADNFVSDIDVKPNFVLEEPLALFAQHKPYENVEEIKHSVSEQVTNDNTSADHNFTSKNTEKSIDNNIKIEQCKTTENLAKTTTLLLAHTNENWTDTDYLNPFIKDCSGIKNELLDMSSYKIIDANSSYYAAIEAIKAQQLEGAVYQCQNCNLLFRHAKRFLIHYKWHNYGQTNERRRQQTEEKEMRRLARKKAPAPPEEGSFPCDMCDSVLGTHRKMLAHRNRAHAHEPRACRVCGETCAGVEELRTHMRDAHSHGEQETFMCDECPKTFKFMHSLIRHQPQHQEKKFGCTQCEKKFGSELLLSIHTKTHEKVLKGTTFHCTYCGKGFYHAYNLSIHERNHRGERPYECDICKSTYATNSSLKRHLKVSHSQNKPFECAVCHRSFISEQIRNRHALRAHSTDAPPAPRRRKRRPRED